MTLFDQLKRDEGLRLSPYKDSLGKLTIGIGRCLNTVGISAGEAQMLFNNDVIRTTQALASALPWTAGLDPVRLAVLQNMAFNMGVQGLLKFQNTLKLIQVGSYQIAAGEMLKSAWANQVGARAQRLSKQMETGQWQ